MNTSLRPDTLASLIRGALVPTALLLAAFPAAATTYTVNTTMDSSSGSGTSGSLRYAINQAGNGDTIQFSCVALGCPVTIPVHLLGNNGGFPGPTAYSIKGKSITIVAPNPGDVTLQAQPAGNTTGTSLRLFFIDSDAGLTLQNVDLIGGRAIGGNGGSAYHGAGGGAAGLGGAIFSQGSLSLVGVSFIGNGAVGGSSAANPNFGVEFGGGGGLGGDGGSAPSGGGGGTGGPGGAPYQSGNVRYSGRGGSGLGGMGGGTPGGRDFVHPHLNFYPPGVASNGGGGGGGYINNAAAGSEGGGGGSGGSAYLSLPAGGNGGFGGGGGGNRGTQGGYCLTVAGNGGFGGGGGSGCGTATNGAIGRRGGVGGGTGSGYVPGGAAAGAGAAFGGAVFARSGSVTVRSPGPAAGISGNSLTAGSGANNGAAVGRALFLMSGVPTTFDIAGSYTIAQDIADDSASSVPNGQGFTPGNGAGATVIKSGAGTLRLDGDNTYAGLTTVAAGTLAGTGGVVGQVRLQGGATMAPGAASAVGGFETGPFTWDGGGTVRLRLGANTAASDQLLVNGALTKGTAGTYAFRFDSGGTAPPPGQVYTLIQSSNAAAFAPGDFSYTVAPGSEGLGGVFSIVGNAVRFRCRVRTSSTLSPRNPRARTARAAAFRSIRWPPPAPASP